MKNTQNVKSKTFSVFRFPFYLLLPGASPAYAEVKIGEKFAPPIKDLTGVGNTVSALVSNLYIIGGIVFLVLFLWAGLDSLRGAGSQDQEKIERAKKIITGAVAGFLIIFASYWIIQLVETITGLKILGK